MTKPFDPDGPALAEGIYGLPHSPEEARVVLIPVPWDATTSYRAGAAEGSRAVLAASRQVDLFDVQLARPYEDGIAMLPESEEIRAWNRAARAAALETMGGDAAAAQRANELGDKLNDWVRAETDRWLDQGKFVGIVGGDHSVPLGGIQALARRHPGLGVLHIDAHADLRVAYEGLKWSHASIMYNVLEHVPEVARIVQVGIRDLGEREWTMMRTQTSRIVSFFDATLAEERFGGVTWRDQCTRVIDALPEEVYVSFDIDGLDPSLCPHTGTPVPGGLSFGEANFLIASIVESGRKIVGFDLCEVAPGSPERCKLPELPEVEDEWDANVGARVLYKLIGWMLKSAAK